MKWIFLVLGLLTNAGASVLIKVGVSHNFVLQLSLRGLLDFAKNWPLIFGVILYGCAFLLYTVALSKLPLNIVHPTMTAGSIVLVGTCSYFIFHERFSIITTTGYCLILSGVFLVSLGK